jgi:F-type H+-transporting ATPase subunit epsilon
MTKTFELIIISHDKMIYEGRASSLIVPSELWYLGILADHAPLVANLNNGRIAIKDAFGSVTGFDSKANGFMEVLKNKVTILLDHNPLTRTQASPIMQ